MADVGCAGTLENDCEVSMKNYRKCAMFLIPALIIGLTIPTACTQTPSAPLPAYQHYMPAYTGSQSDFTRYEVISEEQIESVSDTDLAWVVNYCLQQALSDNSNNYLVSWKDQVLIYQNEQLRRVEVNIEIKVK
jgi:hypothetical protein